jgi:uncharacterized membrane protein YfcA
LELELAGLVVLGFAIAAYGTIVGAGGGFILVPFLLLLYPGLDPDQVTSISLGVVLVSSLSGSISYARQRRIDYATGLIFAASAIPGVFVGTALVNIVPHRLFTGLFGLLLLGVATVSVRNRPAGIRAPLRGSGIIHRTVTDPEGRKYVYAYRVWQGVLMAMGVGLVSSLFGIGGGVISVPAMTILLHIPVQFAVATSLFAVSFMSGNATAIHIATGTLAADELAKTVALVIGAVPGAQAGAYLAQRVRGRVVILLLASAIGLLGVRLLIKAIFGV